MSLSIDGKRFHCIHFAGIFGTGMSALAQYLGWQGLEITGSDRLLDGEDTAGMREKLRASGCRLFSQDGSGINTSTDVLCISTAIEEDNPDIRAARMLGVPVIHRSDVLAAMISGKKTIAVAGTSGKSTVTAMIFEFLTHCGKSPSLISGANLRRLEREGYIGNAFRGDSDLLIVEADESDGTLIKYAPVVAVILNVSKDHKTVSEILSLFRQLAVQSQITFINADDPRLDVIPAAMTFGLGAQADWHPDAVQREPLSGTLFRKGTRYSLSQPGDYNLSNLCAALSVCDHLGCDSSQLAEAVGEYEGVARRFSMTRTRSGVLVIDDYAHNPEKIRAAVIAAKGLARRIVAVYQPHGFGPTRFLKDDYIEMFEALFSPDDALYLLPIYFAGGTAKKDISSQDIVDGLGRTAFSAQALPDREVLCRVLLETVRKGDAVLLMGARDPSLPSLAARMAALFE